MKPCQSSCQIGLAGLKAEANHLRHWDEDINPTISKYADLLEDIGIQKETLQTALFNACRMIKRGNETQAGQLYLELVNSSQEIIREIYRNL